MGVKSTIIGRKIPSNYIALTLIIFCLLNLQGCSKKVTPSIKDDTPPDVGLLVVTKKKLVSVARDTPPKTVYIVPGSELPVLFNTSDPEGARYTKLIILTGGLFRNTEGSLTEDYISENVLNNGQTDTMARASGTIVPDSQTSRVVLRVEGMDWAGNISTTPTITIIQLPAPTAHISASSNTIVYGQSVTITYETENTDEVTINDIPQSTLNGSKIYSPVSSSSYILKARNRVGSTTASVAVSVSSPPPISPPESICFRTNETTEPMWFNLISFDDAGTVWEMSLRSISISGTIITVSNNTGRDFSLIIGGRGSRLYQGETSEIYRGVNLKSIYTAEFEQEANDPIPFVDITVCYED